jgi:four helix bundle protein
MATIQSFEELECWKACREVRQWVGQLVKQLPREERYELGDNINRAARSSTRNIAEGFGRHHHRENLQFCRMSRGSLTETLDDLITCREENYLSEEQYQHGRKLVASAIRILNGYIAYLQKVADTKTQ